MEALAIIVVLAIAFDFINGFHDAPNSIATVVATRVLTPLQAVIWAAFFNFVAFFIAKHLLGGFGIADTVSKIVEMHQIAKPSLVIISGLSAAIFWNLLTWRLGIPSSSSHTLIGGVAGAGLAAAGLKAVHTGIVGLIALFIVLAPMIGFFAGNIITILAMHAFKNVRPAKAYRIFHWMQLLSSALLSIGHGLNDSQKVLGIIAAALIAATAVHPDIHPWLAMTSMDDMHDWVPVACFTAISLGTLVGGWRILRTMGSRITKITQLEGFSAQMAGSISLFVSEMLHIPVSTTHVISGSIIGVGSVKRLAAVRWGVTRSLMWAWVLTIPVSATLGAALYHFLGLFYFP